MKNLAAAARMFLGVTVAFSLISCTRSGKPLQIGLAAPLTGAESQTGQDMRDGVIMAVEEVNATGGIGGRQVELVIRDDKADPHEAAKVAREFVSHPDILAVVGHVNSDCSIAAAEIYSSGSLAMVTPVSTSDELTEKGYRNVFRVPMRNSMQAHSAAKWVAKKKYLRLAVLDDGGAYGSGIAEEFAERVNPLIKSYGGEIVLRSQFKKAEADFQPLLSLISTRQVDSVYFGGTYPAAAQFLQQAAKAKAKFDFVGGDGVFATKFIEAAGGAAEGAIVTFIAPIPGDMNGAQPFYKRFSERFGYSPIAYSPLSYDAAKVVLQALRRANSLERESLRQEIHSRDFSVQGVTGLIRFGESGDNSQAGNQPYLYTVRDGRFVQIK